MTDIVQKIPTTSFVDSINDLLYKNSQSTDMMCKHYCIRALYNHINYNARLVKSSAFGILKLFVHYELNSEFYIINN